jgi:hypothetical protein
MRWLTGNCTSCASHVAECHGGGAPKSYSPTTNTGVMPDEERVSMVCV